MFVPRPKGHSRGMLRGTTSESWQYPDPRRISSLLPPLRTKRACLGRLGESDIALPWVVGDIGYLGAGVV